MLTSLPRSSWSSRYATRSLFALPFPLLGTCSALLPRVAVLIACVLSTIEGGAPLRPHLPVYRSQERRVFGSLHGVVLGWPGGPVPYISYLIRLLSPKKLHTPYGGDTG